MIFFGVNKKASIFALANEKSLVLLEEWQSGRLRQS